MLHIPKEIISILSSLLDTEGHTTGHTAAGRWRLSSIPPELPCFGGVMPTVEHSDLRECLRQLSEREIYIFPYDDPDGSPDFDTAALYLGVSWITGCTIVEATHVDNSGAHIDEYLVEYLGGAV
jgi:hypothetical protein